ncbi:ABC transporter permease [Acidiphilium iwatense]|uniref:ABC transporter permease n=1 Tax=Acidiphilium iwatense TaxID=768198 RepID=A0ABS9DZ86_9PROT|nr:ABC transporter permease [Acidiphilium iwatense]MCF3946991.1 ABC transporter permease [Acidiphilium iwatense]
MLPRPRGVLLTSWLLGGVLLVFIVVPLARLIGSQSAGSLMRVAARPDVRQAILLSLEAALLATCVAAVIGVPLAYALARAEFPGKGIVGAIVDIPLAVPHTVAGIALLFVFGRRGIFGGFADRWLDLRFWGTIAGIVVAMLFVSAPYAVNAARIGFEAVDPRLEKVARTIGMGPWRVLWTITLPLAWRGIATGLTLTYARAISEFAAVVILVYYPMTAPVKIYELFLRFGLNRAAGMATLLLAITLVLLILFRYVAYGQKKATGYGR